MTEREYITQPPRVATPACHVDPAVFEGQMLLRIDLVLAGCPMRRTRRRNGWRPDTRTGPRDNGRIHRVR